MRRITLLLLLAALVVFGALVPIATIGADQEERADLVVDQPDYIDTSVDIEQTSDTVVYRVRGPEHAIRLQNADHENVTAFGVEEGAGSIEFDEDTTLYRFDSEGNEGSTTLFWEVEETTERQEGNETVTDTTTTRYTAVIQVSDVDWSHRPAEEDDELQAAASNWDSVVSEAERLAPAEEADDVISDAFTYYRFFDSPFATFTADMRATLTMMLLRPGGWVITGFFLGISLIGLAYGARYRNRTQKQFEDLDDLWVEKQEAYIEKARRICLQFNDYNQFLPDDVARAMRQYFGRNVWSGFKSYMMLRSPTHIKGIVLQMMAQIGYHGSLQRDDEGAVVAAEVYRDRDEKAPDGGEWERLDLASLRPDDDDHKAFIDRIPASELDFDVFNGDVDLSETSFGIGHVDIEDGDLLDEINPDIPGDFEDEEELARLLAELIQFVLEHEHTDEFGRSRRGMDIISFLAEMDAVLADDADFRIGQIQRRLLLKAADDMDPEDDLQTTVDRVRDEGVA